MFGHIFKYRFLTFMRAKEEVFWNALFPLILATCFMVAFSGIDDKAHNFHSIPVAVVYEQEDTIFKSVITSVSEDDSNGEQFLKLTEADATSAAELLENKKVDAIITVNDSVSVTVKDNGINQTAISSFVTQYLQKLELIKDLGAENITSIFNTANFINDKGLAAKNVSSTLCYYFSLIGMAALFGGFFGLKCARQMKADTTPEGFRKSLSPAKRNTLILAEFLSAYLIHMITLVILFLYLRFVLRLDFCGQLGYFALTCAAGSLVGVSFGMLIGSIPRLKEGLQIGIFLAFSLGSSFLGGLMVAEIKIYFQHHAPIINLLNPTTLIEDSLYSLIIYNTHERYFTNLIILVAYAVVFCAASYFMTRRKSYASL